MEELYLPPLISDEIAKVYLRSIVDIVRDEVKKEIEEKQMPLDQKALMKKFGFDHGYIKKLERRGLCISEARKEENVRRPGRLRNFRKRKGVFKMNEIIISGQVAGTVAIGGVCFIAGLIVSWKDHKKRMRIAKSETLKAIEEGLPEHNAQVIEQYEDELASRRKNMKLYTESPEVPFHVW